MRSRWTHQYPNSGPCITLCNLTSHGRSASHTSYFNTKQKVALFSIKIATMSYLPSLQWDRTHRQKQRQLQHCCHNVPVCADASPLISCVTAQSPYNCYYLKRPYGNSAITKERFHYNMKEKNTLSPFTVNIFVTIKSLHFFFSAQERRKFYLHFDTKHVGVDTKINLSYWECNFSEMGKKFLNFAIIWWKTQILQ